jgi:2-polyprenyl-3-methyl-5-hydroxy-6-metoxy-1,4-benzoquinol methylase
MCDDYSKRADRLAQHYESLSAANIHRTWSHLLPASGSLILDIGAGSGRDAAWLADQGYAIVAADPAKGLLKKAKALHPDPAIEWVEDRLPALKAVEKLGHRYDLILLSAVWMHVAPQNREPALRKMIGLLKSGGKIVITLRQGPPADGRTMYPVTGTELYKLAKKLGFAVILDVTTQDQFGRSEITWNTIVLYLPENGTAPRSLG